MIRTIVTSFALGAVLLIASRARAQTPVTDHANLLQNIRTALQTYQVVQNTAHQIQLMQAQIQNELQTLKSINPASFAGLLALLNQGALTYAMLQGDLATIGY